MHLYFLAIYISFSALLYIIIEFKLRKQEAMKEYTYKEHMARIESGIRRLEDDYQRSLVRFEAILEELKSKNQSTGK